MEEQIKFDLGGFNAYVFNETDDGIYINNCNGFVMEYSQMIEVANKMINYAEKNKEKLIEYNRKRKNKFYEDMNYYHNTNKNSKNYDGYIYFLNCGGKYKIGYTKNIKKRIKQLDYRPYKIELITNSKFLTKAYLIEQEMHKKYIGNKVIGEWYDFTNSQVEEIKKYLTELEEV